MTQISTLGMFLFVWVCGAIITGLLALLTRGRKTYIGGAVRSADPNKPPSPSSAASWMDRPPRCLPSHNAHNPCQWIRDGNIGRWHAPVRSDWRMGANDGLGRYLPPAQRHHTKCIGAVLCPVVPWPVLPAAAFLVPFLALSLQRLDAFSAGCRVERAVRDRRPSRVDAFLHVAKRLENWKLAGGGPACRNTSGDPPR